MNFLEQFQDFLFLLRDSYGFTLPVDRLQAILSCAEDFTDVQEVCFRTQSMLCSSREQVENFQSLFAQRFLGKVPSESGDAREPSLRQQPQKKKKNPYANISDEQLSQRIRERETSMREADRQLESISGRQGQLEFERDTARSLLDSFRREENDKAGELERRQRALEGADRKNLTDPGKEPLAGALKTLGKTVEEFLREAKAADWDSVYNDRVRRGMAELRKSRPQKEYTDLAENLKQTLMAAAREARGDKQSALFPVLLKAAKLLPPVVKAAQKCTGTENLQELEEAKNAVKEAKKDVAEIRKKVRESEETLEMADQSLREMKLEARELQFERGRAEKEIAGMYAAAREREEAKAAEAQLLTKEKALAHRPEFLQGIRAVQTTDEIAEILETDLRRMGADEKQKVLSYIRSGAREFRQTLRRQGNTYQHRRVDVKATIREARKTDGEPIVVKYKAPRQSHARVLILTDISGSCRDASTLSLYFMGLMGEAFPGGCRKFAFVNTLNPVDKYFANRNPDEGVQAVMDHIPTRGVYSDYGETIRQLRAEYNGEIRRDTTVIILGDARNNGRASRAEDLKYIADRVHKLYWLNTDDREKWDQGDSIISEYEKCGAEVHLVQTVGDLLGFLSTISLASVG